MKTIIVTRHPGALAWIQKRHPEFQDAQVIAQAKPDDLAGNRVIGILPVDLAAMCGEYWALNMRIPAEMRGKELTCEDMERFGCSIKRFLVFPEERIAEVEHALAAELSRRVAETLDGDD